MNKLIAIFAIASSLDNISTAVCKPELGCRENNPIAATMQYNPKTLFIVATGVDISTAVYLKSLDKKHHKLAVTAAVALISIRGYCAYSNFRLARELSNGTR